LRIEAVEGFGEFDGEEFFADRFFTREEQRAGHTTPREHAAQSVLRALISDETSKHKGRG
jgi:hypothetical protein